MVFLALAVFAPDARAGSYIVAQCAPGLFAEAPEAGYGTSSSHFTEFRDCSPEAPGVQVGYHLGAGETGTEQGGYGAWVWEAPPGTYITGGSAYSRLASEDGSPATSWFRPIPEQVSPPRAKTTTSSTSRRSRRATGAISSTASNASSPTTMDAA